MVSLLKDLQESVSQASTMNVYGRVRSVVGAMIKASIPSARIGELCYLYSEQNEKPLEAEVIGFVDGYTLLVPIGELYGVAPSSLVLSTGSVHKVPVGDELLGRIFDGFGRPLDGGPELKNPDAYYPVVADTPNPMKRKMITDPLPMGLRAIDGLLTFAEGQRLGIFAAAGGGKSTLLGMLANGADVDVVIIALVGERGREIKEFIEHELGESGLAKSIVVCATSDKSAMERVKSCFVATTYAEYFRDRGKKVLLLLDSVTRFARAQREIGLAAGEPPARRGFPPSVFAMLPRLLERTGMNENGSITAIYTVLVEGDDMNEPVADETRSILDGHVILSRKLGAANHYPAIDILASVSRVMNTVISKEHKEMAGKLRELMAKYDEIELLVRLGEYKSGSDPIADKALSRIDSIRKFLRQQKSEGVIPFSTTLAQLKSLVQ